MEFVNPIFLYGLTAISIPIIIHLFTFRRYKKEYFSNINFLKEIRIKSKKRSQLRQLIILMLRILATVCLVLAFAQPYFLNKSINIDYQKQSAVCIYIDNSFSMESESVNGFLIDEAKKQALEIVKSYKPSDVFQLLTNDFEGKHQNFVSGEDFESWVELVELTPRTRDLSVVVERFSDNFKDADAKNKIIYLISDFQQITSDFRTMDSDTSINIFMVPVQTDFISNISIDSCWFETPVLHENQMAMLNVQVNNVSDEDFEKIPVRFQVNEKQKALASIDIKAGQSKKVVLPFTVKETGIQSGYISINDYPVLFDDLYFLTYRINNRIPVMVINDKGQNRFLNLLFENDTLITLKNTLVSNLDYSLLSDQKLIFLNHLKEISSGLSQQLLRFLENGGSVVVFPSPEMDYSSSNKLLSDLKISRFVDLLEQKNAVGYINTDHVIFNDVFEENPEDTDLPEVFRYYRFSGDVNDRQDVLLEMQSGDPFFMIADYKGGNFYLSAVPLDESFSNFPKHPLFVALLYKIALSSEKGGLNLATIGAMEPIFLPALNNHSESPIKIKKKDSEYEFIPEQQNMNNRLRLIMHNQPEEAGNYLLMKQDEIIDGISFNYDRKESDLRCFTDAEILMTFQENDLNNMQLLDVSKKNMSDSIIDLGKGTPLWKLFIILALVFLAGEIAIIRFWRT